VVVGTPTANRGRREIEGLIGFFVNTLALRVDLSERPTVAELLERVKARALEAQQNQTSPSSRWWSSCSRRAAWRTARSSR
jgi:non-ribosomal peptide synthetase component F